MKIRIIAGDYGGRKIDTPDTRRTHPMSERIRNAIFNSLGGVVDKAEVLDAFAGSGSIGIEAISRGARHATFVERDRVAQKVLTSNIELLGIQDMCDVINTTVALWLDTTNRKKYDVIFADPPYYNPQLSTVKMLMGLLKPGGYMILSHPGRGELPTKTGVVVVDNRSYGNAVLTFYRRDES